MYATASFRIFLPGNFTMFARLHCHRADVSHRCGPAEVEKPKTLIIHCVIICCKTDTLQIVQVNFFF